MSDAPRVAPLISDAQAVATPATFAHILADRAATATDRIAFRTVDGHGVERQQRTYGQLYAEATALAVRIRQHAASGDRVALLLAPGIAFVSALVACFLAGVVAVPAPPPRGKRDTTRVPRLLADAEASLAIVAAGERARLEAQPWWSSTVALLELDEEHPDAVPDAEPVSLSAALMPTPLMPAAFMPGADDLALLQYTSGSTRAPRGVMLTHRQLVANARAMAAQHTFREDDVGMFWLPPYHDMGLMCGILQPMYVGGSVVLMAPATFLQRPLLWLELVQRYRAATTGAPDFAWRLCVERSTAEERGALDLSSLIIAFNGAEPIHYETQHRFVEAFACAGLDPHVFVPSYGLAEATLLVANGAARTPTRTVRALAAELGIGRLVLATATTAEPTVTLVSCGTPPAGTEVAIVNPEGCTRCPAGHEGEIWVRGPAIAGGYWGRPDESQAVFGGRLADSAPDAKPWLRTGDLGIWHEGELYVTGRRSDLIILQGRNIHPQDIEWLAAEAHDALDPSGCVAFGASSDDGIESAVVLVEVARSSRVASTEIQAAVRAAVANGLGLAVQVVCVREQALPRTTSGKRQRRAASASWREGSLEMRPEPRAAKPTAAEPHGSVPTPGPAAAESPAGSLRAWAQQWIATETQQHAVVDTSRSFAELGLESMEVLRFHLALEDRLQRRLPERICWEAPSVEALCDQLEAFPTAVPDDTTTHHPGDWADLTTWPEVRTALSSAAAVQDAFFPLIEGQEGMIVQHAGRPLLHFAGYDYLGLASDERVRGAAAAAANTWGTSASASRLVSGERPVHRALERALATLLGTEAALTFVSGHATAVSVISHLCGPGDLVCCDERIHNSGWLGARTSGARVLVFPHNDSAALDRLLTTERTRHRRVLVAIESLYSADGDVADLAAFVEVKRRHAALLFVDEAHGTGVLGPTGRGLAEASGVDPASVDIWMGTLSKALASCGGFIAGSRTLVQYLSATCPAFVFSVGMPPATAAAALEAVRLLQSEPERVRTLHARAVAFREAAAGAGLPVRTDPAARQIPIVPVVTGDTSRALTLAAALSRDGVLAAPMIPPSVPERGALVRFFVSAAHSEDQIATAVAALARAWHETAAPSR